MVNPDKRTFNLPNLSTARQLVESGSNGRLWWRVYSDGWVEQNAWSSTNGEQKITMSKPMADNAYSITDAADMKGGEHWFNQKEWPDSTTQFGLTVLNAHQVWVEIKGYGATTPKTNNIKNIIKY